MKILVVSSDNGTDLFDAYHHCMEKYWPKHPDIFYSTETVTNPYYKTINKNCSLDIWTKRVRETIQDIDDEFILLMCDDLFLRDVVDNKLIMSLPKYFDDNTAAINFENQFDPWDKPLDEFIMKRNSRGKYKTSMMCQLWRKDKLLSVLEGIDVDPWKFEKLNNHKGFTYLINKNPHHGLIDFGKVDRTYNWGIVKGKWTVEAIRFLRSEGLEVNYSKRGVIHEDYFYKEQR